LFIIVTEAKDSALSIAAISKISNNRNYYSKQTHIIILEFSTLVRMDV